MIDRYIDIHCHILPGIDDGACDLEMSKAMLRQAYEDGIREVIVTPHNKAHRHSAGKETIELLTDELRAWLAQEKISITLHTGSEILYRHELGDLLEAQRICTLADSFYVLVEFNPSDSYAYIKNGIQEIILAGKTPILAHMERYEALTKDTDRIEELIEMGAYMQLNAGTVEGRSGFFLKQKALGWMKKGYIHFVASDAHNNDSRPQSLKKAAQVVAKRLGEQEAQKLFHDHAQMIIQKAIIRA